MIGILVQAFVAYRSFHHFKVIDQRRATTVFLNEIRSQLHAARLAVDQEFGTDCLIGIDGITPEQKITIMFYLDFFEELAVGVNIGVYDLDVVTKMMGGSIVNERRRFDNFIRGVRIEQGRSSIYSEFVLMAADIRKIAPRNMIS